MFREIIIKDFTILDSVKIELEEGLNVLTGETGAGKSIIIDALGLILGQKAQAAMVKSGKKEALIEAFFDITSTPVTDRLGINVEEGAIVRRIISSSGKNRIYINDNIVSLQTLIELGNALVDIHGQNEHQSLINKSKQIEILDSFAKISDDVKEFNRILGKYKTFTEERKQIADKTKEILQRLDLLSYQIEEIEAANLSIGEKEPLLEEHSVLANLTEIKELSEGAYALLYSSEDSVSDRFSAVNASISQLYKLDKKVSEMKEISENALSLIEELSLTLRQYKEAIDFSPQRLEEVENRLETIGKLEKKYGENIEAIVQYKDSAKKEYESLLLKSEKPEVLDKEIEELNKALNEMALELSQKRTNAALILEKEINETLTYLSFQNARFKVDIKTLRNEDGSMKYLSKGADSVEFLFSANPGEDLKPLQKVASGGELSRVMLAIKSCVADYDDIPILVFDEVDAGIGGQTAEKVGQQLRKTSKHHQVICVTHLPQIASKAHNHLRINKSTAHSSVHISVERLVNEEREKELARMLSGTITDVSLEHARELLRNNP
ncbi:DNA repair protein RecN [Candidatus Magnetoovum chiemensis]|nr:DNA repair protein RecN [Candidatus Magnetoovum chiemensis]